MSIGSYFQKFLTAWINILQADWRKKETAPAPSWPEKGAVKATDLALRYREGLDLVLKGINVDIKAGEKVSSFDICTIHCF